MENNTFFWVTPHFWTVVYICFGRITLGICSDIQSIKSFIEVIKELHEVFPVRSLDCSQKATNHPPQRSFTTTTRHQNHSYNQYLGSASFKLIKASDRWTHPGPRAGSWWWWRWRCRSWPGCCRRSCCRSPPCRSRRGCTPWPASARSHRGCLPARSTTKYEICLWIQQAFGVKPFAGSC